MPKEDPVSDARALRTVRMPHTPRGPLHVGLFTRARLNHAARRDARAGVPHAAYEPDRVGGATPVVHGLQAHAAGYAQREGQRFLTDVRAIWVEQEALAQIILREQREYAERSSALELAAARSARDAANPMLDATSPAHEDLRRLERRLQRDHRRSAHLKALIHTRFTVARLRARRYFDYTDQEVAVYWGTLRRTHPSAENISDRPPALERPQWVTVEDGDTALRLWHGSDPFGGTPLANSPLANSPLTTSDEN
jgi:hypothetical protein